MAIDNISLLAQTLYTKVQNQPKVAAEADPATQAVKFQEMVERQFNSFSKLTPAQILQVIKNARPASAGSAAAGFASSAGTVAGVTMNADIISQATGEIRKTLQKQDEVVRKSLINEASLIDILTATTETKNLMEITVKVRDKFMDAFDKVMNMSM